MIARHRPIFGSLRPLLVCSLLGNAAWCFFTSGLVAAEETTYGGGEPPRAEARFTTRAPTIDGRWSPGEWDDAAPISILPAAHPSRAASATEVRFLWNTEGVFVAFRTLDRTPIYGHTKLGESLHREDVFELFIDQLGDHHQFYELQIAPSGQLYLRNHILTAPPRLTAEGRLTQEFVERELWRYDLPIPPTVKTASIYDVATQTWSAELFLPASLINRRRDPSHMTAGTWRLNLVRHDWDLPLEAPNRQGTFLYWAPVLPGHPHLSPAAMGWLTFSRPASTPE